MAAAPGNFVITPLTTVAESLVRLHGFTRTDAEARVTEAFGLAGVSLGTFDPLKAIADGNVSGALAYIAHVEIYNTVLPIRGCWQVAPARCRWLIWPTRSMRSCPTALWQPIRL